MTIDKSFQSLYNKTTLSQLHPETTYEIMSYLLIKGKTIKVIKSKELEIRTLAKGYTPGGIATAVASPVRLNKHKLLNVDIIWSPVKGKYANIISYEYYACCILGFRT